VILVSASGDALGVREVTRTIPIVSAGTGDLVADGLAASLARLGGTVTGLSTPVIGSKQLELFREAVPGLARVAVLHDTAIGSTARAYDAYEAVARPLGLQLQVLGAGGPDELEPAFEAAVRGGADGMLLAAGSVVANHQPRIVDLATRHRLLSMWSLIEAADRGGLMADGPNRADLYRRAATYVDKILQGAKPADLTVEQPTKYDLAINLKTATELGLTIPPSVLHQATEVVQ
jgi:putative tryptophan/tyrosine transport system substrate-binding protein